MFFESLKFKVIWLFLNIYCIIIAMNYFRIGVIFKRLCCEIENKLIEIEVNKNQLVLNP